MANAVMADSISYLPEFQGWYTVIKEELGEIDLGQLLIYIIDSVDPSLLPVLGAQFDVLGYNGFRLAQSDDDRRSILKNAIALHKYKGVEWAIIQALANIGFPDIEYKGGIAGGYDHWAKFGITLTNNAIPLTSEGLTEIIAMVNAYKRAVCVLEDISMNLLIEEALTVSDDNALVADAIQINDNLSLSGTLLYDGTGHYDGNYDHSGDSDVVTIT